MVFENFHVVDGDGWASSVVENSRAHEKFTFGLLGEHEAPLGDANSKTLTLGSKSGPN